MSVVHSNPIDGGSRTRFRLRTRKSGSMQILKFLNVKILCRVAPGLTLESRFVPLSLAEHCVSRIVEVASKILNYDLLAAD